MPIRSLFVLIAFTLTACSDGRIAGPDPEPPPVDEGIQSGPARGLVFGTPWSFLQGSASLRTSGGAQMYLVRLWAEEFQNPCDSFNNPSKTMIFMIPATVGTYKLNSNRTVTFSDGVRNYATLDGLYKITAISPDPAPGKITAGIIAYFDEENDVNGTFEVTICN